MHVECRLASASISRLIAHFVICTLLSVRFALVIPNYLPTYLPTNQTSNETLVRGGWL